MFVFRFEELNVYRNAIDLATRIYVLTKTWPKDERFGLVDQIRRAISSIALNIAEGSSRSKKDFGHFLDIAKGSCYECVAILTMAKKLQYINHTTFTALYAELEILVKQLSALKRSILNPSQSSRPITKN